MLFASVIVSVNSYNDNIKSNTRAPPKVEVSGIEPLSLMPEEITSSDILIITPSYWFVNGTDGTRTHDFLRDRQAL